MKGTDSMANSNINIRIDSETKVQAQELFSSLGLDMSTAVNIFIRQALSYGGIPFSIRQTRYNSETETAIEVARVC
jgi:DNA-damage-inducible protein J